MSTIIKPPTVVREIDQRVHRVSYLPVAHAERTIESLLEAIQLDGFNNAYRRCYPTESELEIFSISAVGYLLNWTLDWHSSSTNNARDS